MFCIVLKFAEEQKYLLSVNQTNLRNAMLTFKESEVCFYFDTVCRKLIRDISCEFAISLDPGYEDIKQF